MFAIRILPIGIHFTEQSSQRRRIASRERTEFFAESALANSTNLIHGDLGVFACNLYWNTCPPLGMQLAGERTDNDGFQEAIEHIETNDHRWPRLP